MVNWRIHDDKRREALEAFSQMTAEDDRRDIGDDIRLIGRWHDLVSFTGLAIFETDDPHAIAAWLLNWNAILDAEVTPVLDDEETRKVGRKKFGQGPA
jgi:hypothetical protein